MTQPNKPGPSWESLTESVVRLFSGEFLRELTEKPWWEKHDDSVNSGLVDWPPQPEVLEPFLSSLSLTRWPW